MNSKSNQSNKFKNLFGGKKAKMTIYVIGVLWIAVIMQVVVNKLYQPKGNLLEAFVSTNSEVASFELEMTANYGSGYLSESDKKELIMFIANKIGLQIDQNAAINNAKDNAVYIEKKSRNAESLIKVVSVDGQNNEGLMQVNHYILVRLKIYKKTDSILKYRELLKDAFKHLNASNVQTTMQLSANYKGKLSLIEMNQIADGMVENLQGKIAYANRQENLYTIYAYSGLLDEYVTSVGTKINIHVAINYDEAKDTTNVYLGTPVINGGY